MLNYCQRVTGCLKTPTLIEEHKNNINYNELPSEILSGRYNGGIDIPMSDEEEDLEDINDSQFENNDTDENNLKKRRLSDSDGGKFKEIKKKKNEERIIDNKHHLLQ